jgi:hypothetical protein
MQVIDMNKLSDNVVIAQVNDSAGQDLERSIVGNMMNNYFGNLYVDQQRT